MLSNPCRVRFAPSPTGHLHLGSLRSALFNWLFARHHNGVFLLRIEDTDFVRSQESYTQALLEAFAWCDIASDEPMLIQSHRISIYQDAAEKLLQKGLAYRCVCTREAMTERIGKGAADGGYALYDGHCRNLAIGSDNRQPFAIRFKLPDAHNGDQSWLTFDDLIRGQISYARDQFDDFIILRSDSMPTYNFCVVIDDAYSRITHIIRGEEHLINTPRQIALYQAFNYTLPAFAHIPLILGPDGSKLSKRDCATAVVDYMRAGFLPQALCNYLVRLGWSHGDQEIFSRQELINYFDLAHVGKKGSIFDSKKLEWVNSVYLKQESAENIFQIILEHIDEQANQTLAGWNKEQILTAIHLYQPRCTTGLELYSAIKQLQRGDFAYSKEDLRTFIASEDISLLIKAQGILAQQAVWDQPSLQTALKNLCKELHKPLGALGKPLRYAITGSIQAPGIFELLALLGLPESMLRIDRFISLIHSL